jgi:hypothetical protein
MAITIMGGLFVATALTLLMVPALGFRVRNKETVDATDGLLWRRPRAPAIGVAHTVLVGKSRPIVCRRRVGRLDALVLRGAGISSDRRKPPSLNCSETRAPRSCAPRATQRRATPGEAGETGYPQKPVFASADAMQRYRCVTDRTWPQLSRLSRHARGHAVEDTAGRKFVAEKY